MRCVVCSKKKVHPNGKAKQDRKIKPFVQNVNYICAWADVLNYSDQNSELLICCNKQIPFAIIVIFFVWHMDTSITLYRK